MLCRAPFGGTAAYIVLGAVPVEACMMFRLGELFCGPGGLAWGAINARADGVPDCRIVHAWATDYDRDACETYRHNICKGEGIVKHIDIRHLDFGSLSEIDALAFGFPCNDFSVIGERRGVDGTYGPLYSYGVGAIRHFRPQWFLA